MLDQSESNRSLGRVHISGGRVKWQLHWPDLGIKAIVKNVGPEGKTIKGVIKFEYSETSPVAPESRHIRRRLMNLLNPDAKHISDLRKKDPEIPWDDLIEQMNTVVYDDYNMGIPVEDMSGGGISADTDAQWLIHPLVEEGNPTLIYGKGSSGKSWLGQTLSILVHEGLSVDGLTVKEGPHRVLYLDWETTSSDIRKRFGMIRSGLGLEGVRNEGLLYKAMTRSLAEDLEAVLEVIQDQSIDFCVLDSAGYATGGHPEDSGAAMDLFSAIRELRVSSVVISHVNKAGSLFGSEYFWNNPRFIFEAHKYQTEGDKKVVTGLFNRKSNNAGLLAPIVWELDFSELGTVTLSRRNPEDTGLEPLLHLRDRIINLLREQKIGGLTVAHLAEVLEKSEGHIRKEISTNKDLFEKLEDGTYTIKNRITNGEEAWTV